MELKKKEETFFFFHLKYFKLQQFFSSIKKQKQWNCLYDDNLSFSSLINTIFIPLAFQDTFPRSVRIVLVLKPESVLQRALEVGYRGLTENCKFKVSKFFSLNLKNSKLKVSFLISITKLQVWSFLKSTTLQVLMFINVHLIIKNTSLRAV